ncbi:M91 family zinc metallopeptidase [Iamia majanohamensis]|uniref:M91 family zinc metallopeptidase n=1 Tax=Iamia majanohamensis TaxID=467976 RepID=A0AAE9Y7G4_9ACTN|nr:M91 family zinc metallopeptidase [Iamia majanohamensis]WCO65714.1 M91 family zinc metallopeptidase [Iamia majanohamensis]
MTTASARPADLAAFRRDVDAARRPLVGATADLRTALAAVRTADVTRWVGAIGRLEDQVEALEGEDAWIAGWVGDVGEAFRAADGEGATVTTTDDRIAGTVPRVGDGEVTVRTVDGQTVVDTGDGDDEVTVTERDGRVVIDVDGVEHVVDGATGITIRSGSGDDTISLPSDVSVRFVLDGGADDDRIHGSDDQDDIFGSTGDDTLEAGDGGDVVDGGDGRDYLDGSSGSDLLTGGRGHDTIYGGDGLDDVLGGQGRDHLDGGTGTDTVLGGRHDDVVSGGDDGDRLGGGAGDDVIYGGTGPDEVLDLAGDDTAYVQTDDSLLEQGFLHTRRVTVDLSDLPSGSGIRIEGSDEFVQRVEADLATLASSPVGQQMLAAMDDIHEQTKAIAADWPVLGGIAYQGDTVVIREYDEPNGGASYQDYWLWRTNEISYNPSHDTMYGSTFDPDDVSSTVNWREVPPVVILQHELAHQFDYGYETSAPGTYGGADDPGVPNDEREAVGLPLDDGDLADGHPFTYTENGLREEMGLPPRGSYGDTAP